MRKDRFEIWLDQARAARLGGGWRIAFGVVFAAVLGVLLQFLCLTAVYAVLGAATGNWTEPLPANVFVWPMLLSFASLWISVFLARRWLHGLPFPTIWGWSRRFESRPFWGGAACAVTGNLIAWPLIALYLRLSGEPEAAEAGWNPPEGILWMALALIPAVFIQAGAEEALCRGHMTQMLAARWRDRVWIWAGLPSLIFSGLHIFNGADPGQMPYVYGQMLFAALIGFLCAAMTRAQGGISAAIGFHACNNYMVFLTLFLTTGEAENFFVLQEGMSALSAMTTGAIYVGACVWAATTPRLPFRRWIGGAS